MNSFYDSCISPVEKKAKELEKLENDPRETTVWMTDTAESEKLTATFGDDESGVTDRENLKLQEMVMEKYGKRQISVNEKEKRLGSASVASDTSRNKGDLLDKEIGKNYLISIRKKFYLLLKSQLFEYF